MRWNLASASRRLFSDDCSTGLWSVSTLHNTALKGVFVEFLTRKYDDKEVLFYFCVSALDLRNASKITRCWSWSKTAPKPVQDASLWRVPSSCKKKPYNRGLKMAALIWSAQDFFSPSNKTHEAFLWDSWRSRSAMSDNLARYCTVRERKEDS